MARAERGDHAHAGRRSELLRQGKPLCPGRTLRSVASGPSYPLRLSASRRRPRGARGKTASTSTGSTDAWGWHDPAGRRRPRDAFGGVPRLAESLRRVWFEKDLGDAAGGLLARGLEKLRLDYVSGARQLAGVGAGRPARRRSRARRRRPIGRVVGQSAPRRLAHLEERARVHGGPPS